MGLECIFKVKKKGCIVTFFSLVYEPNMHEQIIIFLD